MTRESESQRIAYIKISNLTEGVHHYAFECVASDFADEMLDSERFASPISITATLTKTVTEIVAELSVCTTLSLQCDRCLAPIEKTISGHYRILFLQSPPEKALDDDVRLLSRYETHIDLTADVRETLLLAVPMKNVCQAGCAENDAPIVYEFFYSPAHTVEGEWHRQLAEVRKKMEI